MTPTPSMREDVAKLVQHIAAAHRIELSASWLTTDLERIIEAEIARRQQREGK